MEQIKKGIVSTAGLLHTLLTFGQYGTGKEIFEDLVLFCEEIGHAEMVALVNQTGVTDHRAGWIAKAWCVAHGIKQGEIEFETAGCIPDSIGAAFDLRRNKKTWGALVAIRPASQNGPIRKAASPLQGDAALRMAFYLKAENPIRLKQTTRNEVKLLIGPKAVSTAMTSKKGEFIAEIGPHEAARLERITGLPIGKLWGAIKNGDKALVDRLSLIPNKQREQMRKRGMYVADHYEPQLKLF